jgi:hypothetical protein
MRVPPIEIRIAQVIIGVRYQHVQGHASVQLARVISCPCSVLSLYIDEFRITSALNFLLPTVPISGNVLYIKSSVLDADYRTDTKWRTFECAVS